MHPITVAVAENDQMKRRQLEHHLRQNNQNIEVLTDENSLYNKNMEIRLKSRNNQSLKANTVARIKRLRPRVLFVNAQQLTQESFDLLHELNQHCPGTLPVVLVKEEVDDSQVLQVLESGARGIVNCSVKPINVSLIVETVNRGEPWVSRKILVKIMDKIKLT
ncbi:MAG: response regulator transcription factor [Burkholderiales bacterium]|nr:response regulator transcription factor [Burkholderiales bacterium]